GDHQIALALLDPAHQRHQRRSRMDLAAGAGQCLGQHGADGAIVVGDKYGAVHQTFSLVFGAAARGATGSDRRKTVRPGTDSAVIQPPWSATIFDTSARPRPVPFSRPETKGSKIDSAISGGMPGPSSMISICNGKGVPAPSTRRSRSAWS